MKVKKMPCSLSPKNQSFTNILSLRIVRFRYTSCPIPVRRALICSVPFPVYVERRRVSRISPPIQIPSHRIFTIKSTTTSMKRYIQHEDLKISHFTTTRWEHPVHNHNHFEIIFIHKGKGRHCLSGSHYPYSSGNLFLLAPSDTHHFEIEEETEFTFLKFTNVYLGGVGNIQMQEKFNQEIDHLLMEAQRRNAPLLQDSPEAGK